RVLLRRRGPLRSGGAGAEGRAAGGSSLGSSSAEGPGEDALLRSRTPRERASAAFAPEVRLDGAARGGWRGGAACGSGSAARGRSSLRAGAEEAAPEPAPRLSRGAAPPPPPIRASSAERRARRSATAWSAGRVARRT